MDSPLPTASDLDWKYSRECPRCGDEAGWNGSTGRWEGHLGLELTCVHCGYIFSHDSGQWEKEFSQEGIPVYSPGRPWES